MKTTTLTQKPDCKKIMTITSPRPWGREPWFSVLQETLVIDDPGPWIERQMCGTAVPWCPVCRKSATAADEPQTMKCNCHKTTARLLKSRR
jgi:hypothetical protein